uniref:Site-specific integrase n=1 Tax=candidate division WOR-3 bacterium TaxID=2052148 RepID=A0A7V3NUT1_UNCW3
MKREKTKYKGIYKVGSTYYITYYVGNRKYEKAVGRRLSDALREKMLRENRGKRGNYEVLERQEKTSFNQLIEFYEREGDGKDYILQFIPVYKQYFGERKLSQITRKDLFAFRDALKATPKQRGGAEITDSTVNRALAGLRRLFNFAVSREFMEESPFPKTSKSGLFYPEKKGLRNFFTEDQMEKIVEAAPPWLRPMILTSYYTGLREGELLSLRWQWIDLQDGVIYLPSTKTLKDPTGKGQKVVMQRELVSLLKSLPRKSDWVFCRPSGEPFKQWHIYKPFKKVLQAVGIDPKNYSWKELRHTTASLMHRKGVPVLAIKDQLRHTNIKTTVDFYVGADLSYQREQIEKLRLNSGKIVGNENLQTACPIATA